MLAKKLKRTKSHGEQKAIRWNDFIYHTYTHIHWVTVRYVFIKFLETVNECGWDTIRMKWFFSRLHSFSTFSFNQSPWLQANESNNIWRWKKLCGKKEREERIYTKSALNELHQLTCLMMGNNQMKERQRCGKKSRKSKQARTKFILASLPKVTRTLKNAYRTARERLIMAPISGGGEREK